MKVLGIIAGAIMFLVGAYFAVWKFFIEGVMFDGLIDAPTWVFIVWPLGGGALAFGGLIVFGLCGDDE
jgi:hypothetical protein